MDITSIPRYSERNLSQQTPYDPHHDHWAVMETVGAGIGVSRVVEDFGLRPRHRDGRTAAPEHVLARRRAAELNQQSFAEHIAGRKFTRYLTFRYVAVDPEECKRHAALDRTQPDKIRVTPEVAILHYAGSWMLWDDGKITTGIGIDLPRAGVLTPAAQSLISTVRGADGGTVHLPGGILALAKIDEVLEETTVRSGPDRGLYAAEKIERLQVRWRDGAEGELYAVTAGYFEGYRYDLFPTLAAAQAEFGASPGTAGITDFPSDDFDYHPDLGYVSKD